jgi:hypothetical protein
MGCHDLKPRCLLHSAADDEMFLQTVLCASTVFAHRNQQHDDVLPANAMTFITAVS